MNITPPAYRNVLDEEEDREFTLSFCSLLVFVAVESAELHNRSTFLLISIVAGAGIGGFLTLITWLLIRRFIFKGLF